MDRTDILHQIVEAERGAQKLFTKARHSEESLSEYLETERLKILQRERKKADELLCRYETEEHKRCEKEIRLMDEALKKDLARLAALFTEKRDLWVEELFARVVGDL